MTITAQDLVRREVHYCVSSLVHTLAQSYAYAMDNDGDLPSLIEQAAELAAPVPDYEEAAREAGWTPHVHDHAGDCFINAEFEADENNPWFARDWEDLCNDLDIEPYYREVFEHWIVSDWLADKLSEKGEKVDKDFAGMTVWARTTTGQAIYGDWVIEQIAADLNKPEASA